MPRRVIALLRSARAFAGDASARLFVKMFALESANAWSIRVAQRLAQLTRRVGDDREFAFIATNPLLLWRAATLLSKEPETIAWIRTFTGDDVLYDIGANIGTYSLYAARRCRKVYAFEPEASNFAVLNRNIQINALSHRITAFPVAIADANKIDTLRLSSLETGAALHAFGTDVDFKGDRFAPVFAQGSIAVTLDELVYRYGLEQPTHIKLDVDGLDRAILGGGRRVLRERRLKSVLVEINELDAADAELVALLEQCGLMRTGGGAAIRDQAGRYAMRNCIFTRSHTNTPSTDHSDSAP